MVKKGGLGKGLSALIPQKEDKEKETTIALDLIKPRADQPRQYFDEAALDELAGSIREYGLIQPIIVRREKDAYEIIAGERRYRAAKKAGLNEVPVIVRTVDDKLMRELSLIENIQRENLNPVEEARAYVRLKEDYAYTQEQLAEVMGKSRPYIANLIRLLKLDEDSLSALENKEITASQGRTLLSIADIRKRRRYLEAFRRQEMSVHEAEGGLKKKKRPEDPYQKDLEDRLVSYFATKVDIKKKRKGGSIVIHYLSDEDLSRIMDLLEG